MDPDDHSEEQHVIPWSTVIERGPDGCGPNSNPGFPSFVMLYILSFHSFIVTVDTTTIQLPVAFEGGGVRADQRGTDDVDHARTFGRVTRAKFVRGHRAGTMWSHPPGSP